MIEIAACRYEHTKGLVRPTQKLANQQQNQIMKRKPLVQCTIVAVAVFALVSVLSSAALGANPAEEMAKVGTTDPKGNSWLSIQNSIEQFGHPEFILRLFLSLGLAVGCAWVIAWHPRRSSLANPLSDLGERICERRAARMPRNHP